MTKKPMTPATIARLMSLPLHAAALEASARTERDALLRLRFLVRQGLLRKAAAA